MSLNPEGRNWGPLLNWDALGKAYAGAIIIWTTLLFSGIVWLIVHRHVAYIRMRNLPLAITSTCFLHIYLVKIFLAYTTNGNFTCTAEFWIMSIYLPFGISLFQANVMQLKSVSEQQGALLKRQLSDTSTSELLPRQRTVHSIRARWNGLTKLRKAYVCIGAGIGIQLIVTVVLYATTPTLQGDWRSYGDIPFPEGQALCRKSNQWIPSAFWQLFWSWVCGPYVLFQIRSIKDVHHWRVQTFLSVIAGLPGTPLWLTALHSPAFSSVNPWFVPPMWLAPGVMVMQLCTIFFPIYEAIESSAQLRGPAKYLSSTDSLPATAVSSCKNTLEEKPNGNDPHHELHLNNSPARRSIYSIHALEKALAANPVPLLEFAATRDFTAENVVFLIHVMRWRDAWKTAPREASTGLVTESAKSKLFRLAVDIYTEDLCCQTADFPVNVESAIRRTLDDFFSGAIPDKKGLNSNDWDLVGEHGAVGSAPPPVDIDQFAQQFRSPWEEKKEVEVTITPASPDEQEIEITFQSNPCVAPLGLARARIPSGFDSRIFEAAESSVKYLVLTNTWRRFAMSREKSGELGAVC